MPDIENKKQSPVVDEHYIRPAKANERMKKAQSIRQTVYISGACGYGKSSFVADYLARRRYDYYSMTDTELTKDICPPQDGKEHILVIDDLHELSGIDERQTALEVLTQLVEDKRIWLILISRSPVPAWLMPLYVERIFVPIGECELSLSEKESRRYLDGWELSVRQDTEEALRQMTEGYPLALRIAALQLALLPQSDKAGKERMEAEHTALEEARQKLYDYLETRVYDQWDVELTEFLMDISILERFDIPAAQLVTKKNHAGSLIRQAKETGTFLTETRQGDTVSYEMRKHMRLSMQRRLESRCTKTHIDELCRSAGESYELAEDLTAALAMYERCGYEEGISRILVENARHHAGSGHYWELRKYYLILPEERIKENPELMAGMSLLQSILLNDEESERWYRTLREYTKRQTGSTRKAAQARLLYLDIVLPQRGTGQMTEILKHAWTFMTERKTILPEMSLTNNQPTMMHGGKDFCEWSRRDRELAKSIGKPVELLLGRFGKGLVNLALAESFFEKGADSYEVSVLAQKGKMQAQAGGMPEQEFVGTGLLVWLSVINNCMEDAKDSLSGFRDGMAERAPRLLPGIDAFLAVLLLYTGKSGEAAQWLSEAPDEDAEFCTLERYRYMVKVRVYLATGRRERAQSLLTKLLLYAKKRQRTWLVMEANILLAITQYRRNDEHWKETLQEAVAMAESYHFVRILTREGTALWELLEAADLTWLNENYRKQVLAECEQMAKYYPLYLNERQEGGISLSDKALLVLRLQAEGLKIEQIAEKLGISKSGVKYYNQETYKKLGVNSKAAAIAEARNRKLI